MAVRKSRLIDVNATGGAVVDQELFTCPNGYLARINSIHIASVGGASSVTLKLDQYVFVDGKTVPANDYIVVGGDSVSLVIDRGDIIECDCPSGRLTILITYDLLPTNFN